MKLKWRASQTLRANKIADELNGYVKTLSWHLHNLMVRCGKLTNLQSVMLMTTSGCHELVITIRS